MAIEILQLAAEYSGRYFPLFFAMLVITTITAIATKFFMRIDAAVGDIPDMKRLLAKIDKGLSMLNAALLEKNIITQTCYSNDNSPRVVNRRGEHLLAASGAGDVLQKILPDLLVALTERKPANRLAIEREALNVLLERRDDPLFNGIQNFVYEYPKFEGAPLSYTDVLFVMSLGLRDTYMEKNDSASK